MAEAYQCSACGGHVLCNTEHVTSNSGKRSDAFHSTSENSGNLNR